MSYETYRCSYCHQVVNTPSGCTPQAGPCIKHGDVRTASEASHSWVYQGYTEKYGAGGDGK